MTVGLNIAAIAQRTGVAPDTLRKWEKRYGVLRPERTAGGQRRYSDEDVARVEWLRARLDEGWRIGAAARVLNETSAATPHTDPEQLRIALREAAAATAPARIEALLDQTFGVLPLERSLSEVVSPTLEWIGDEWHAGRLSVAAEHAFTAKVRAKLEQQMADPRAGVRGTCVLACAPGELHDLGLLMLGVALRADGWRVEYLGASMPSAEVLEFATAVGARLVCFSTSRGETLERLRAELAASPTPAVDLSLMIGGPGVRKRRAGPHGAIESPDIRADTVDRLRPVAA